MELSTRRRRALSTGLAFLLAIESVTAVAAAAQVTVAARGHAVGGPAAAPGPTASPHGEVLAESSLGWARIPDAGLADRLAASSAPFVAPAAPVRKPDRPEPAQVPAKMVPAAPSPAAAPPSRASSSQSATTYSGKNHVWIPSLGINRTVSAFPCDRTRPPDNLVYRWGCAGTNNVYLLGHAYSVFKPLHDAYGSHRLKVGMKVYYADGKGTVHVYAVKWWKLTLPTTDASWAWAAQDTPSMTLQTCVGANSEYRLMVRLAEVSG
jgi:Sortase domain